MRTLPAGEFKAKCLAIMDEVQETGEAVVITKRGKPVAQLTALDQAVLPERTSVFGFMRGLAEITGDIVSSPFSDKEWEQMEEESFARSIPADRA